MKRPLRFLVIGGVAAGTKGASKARREDPSMEITLITDEEFVSYAGCGLAYYVGGVVDSRDKLFARSPEAFRTKQNINVLLRHRAERINTYDREVTVTDLSTNTTLTLPYDRLLIATGASAVIPPIKGHDMEGIFALHTVPDADTIKAFIARHSVKIACILGGGYIGAEMAENLVGLGISVTLFEVRESVMSQMFDTDISKIIREHMESKGVTILTETPIDEFISGGDGSVNAVRSGSKNFDCQLAIIAAGVRPNIGLAKDARITTGITGAIKVDKHMETSVRGIYAAGDCAESTHLVSGKPCWFPLGSTANKQGRVAGATIAGNKKIFNGLLGTSIVKVFDLTVGRTGLNEREAKEAGFNPISATVTAPVRAGYYPGGGKVTLKLTADRKSGLVLGAQAVGENTVDKIIDTMAGSLTGKLTVPELSNLDISYSPPYATAIGTVALAAQVLDEML